MKILITGGLGQVGSYLCERLSEHNEVTIIDNFSNSLNNIKLPSKIKIIRGDIRNQKTVNELASKANTIIHTAAQTTVNKSIEDPVYDADNNINGTLNLLEAARRSDIERFIYISSAAVYGDPITLPINEEHPANPLSPYGLSKLTGEKYTRLYYRLYELPTVCLRPFNIFSPRQNPNNPYSGVITEFIERIRNDQNPVIFGDGNQTREDGNQTRDFVYIEDVVEAVSDIMEKRSAIGEVFNIGTGRPTRIRDMAETIIRISNKELEPKFEQALIGDIRESYAEISRQSQTVNAKDLYIMITIRSPGKITKKGLKSHPYCIQCGMIKNISSDRERPLGYYMNILSHLRITKVQTRLIVPTMSAKIIYNKPTNSSTVRPAFLSMPLSVPLSKVS
ncbi:nucleoside-diphosphate-sugar epimerase [groundwater metagenome]